MLPTLHLQVEKHQMELDRLGATLKQIETYNEEMKSEIAVTRRAAYAAEGAVQKLEKEKLHQDLRWEQAGRGGAGRREKERGSAQCKSWRRSCIRA